MKDEEEHIELMFKSAHPERYYEKERNERAMSLAIQQLETTDASNEMPDADIVERTQRVMGTKLDEVE